MLYEISYVLGEDTPKWPGNPKEEFEVDLSQAKGDLCNTTIVRHFLHTGTHVDAPKHFFAAGKDITQIPIEDFYYTSPFLARIPKGKGELITVEDLKAHEKEIENCDLLCVYTGNADLRAHSPFDYTDNFPSFAPEAAKYLRMNFPKMKAIALDLTSCDSGPEGAKNGFPSHHALLDDLETGERPLLLYEDVNLKLMSEIQEPIKAVCAFPVRWENAEAAPIAMVVIT